MPWSRVYHGRPATTAIVGPIAPVAARADRFRGPHPVALVRSARSAYDADMALTYAYAYRSGTIYLNVTNRCSNDCVFCVRQGSGTLAGYDLRLDEEPDAAAVCAALERAAAEEGDVPALDEVVFCGFGEPTYRLALIGEVGRHLRERGVPVRLNTNGQAALIHGRDPFPTLRDAVDHASISLNASDRERYVQRCQPRFGPEAWDAVLDFARTAVATLPRVTLTVVGFTLQDDELEGCEELADRLGAELRVR